MIHLPNTTGDRLEVNALFIQPTRWCAHNCKGCYVKAHESTTEQTPQEQQLRLFQLFYDGIVAHANQITISLDTLPENEEQRRHMTGLISEIIRYLSDNHQPGVQIHITARDIDTLKEYDLHHWQWEQFTVVSLSNITETQAAGAYTRQGSENSAFTATNELRDTIGIGVHLNWNYSPPPNMSSLDIDKHIDKFINIAKSVNSVYMIAHKSPVGKHRDPTTRLHDRSRWRSDILCMKTILNRVPADIKKKIQIDGCIRDVVREATTGFGCSSGISRFQVWPDGSVSGCPYAHKGNTGPGRTANEIIENIRKSRKVYDYERCHLPEIHHSLSREPSSRK